MCVQVAASLLLLAEIWQHEFCIYLKLNYHPFTSLLSSVSSACASFGLKTMQPCDRAPPADGCSALPRRSAPQGLIDVAGDGSAGVTPRFRASQQQQEGGGWVPRNQDREEHACITVRRGRRKRRKDERRRGGGIGSEL